MIRAFSFLQRNPDSGILYFRYQIPEKYRTAFGKREIKFSLGTADKRIAIVQALEHYSAVQKKLIRLDAKMKKRKPEPEEFFSKISMDEIDSSGTAKNVVIDCDGDTAKEIEQYRLFREMLAKPIAPPAPIAPITPPLSSDSIKLAILFKRFREEKHRAQSWTPKTAMEHEATHNLAIQILGNIESGLLSYKHGREVKEILLRLPPNAGKRGMTVKQTLATNPQERMNLKTVNTKLERLSSAFQWAIPHGYITVNPFDGLQIKEKRGQREQQDKFEDEDLKRIFNPETFTVDALGDDWKFWIPLMALYTGGRLMEIAQLRTEDVFEEDGIVAIRITPEAGHLKNIASKRIVPIHSKLITLGFTQYLERIKAQKADKLFPRLWGTVGGPGKKAGNWFNRIVIQPLNLEGNKSFHSFRHSFIDALFNLVEDKVRLELSGHTHGDIGANVYAKGLWLATLKNGVEKLDFPIELQPKC
ncbi:MAG: site-specific integrase [Sulfuricurvum sp.]|nr:site-specific integrase [Sulfuricurvum sp.]